MEQVIKPCFSHADYEALRLSRRKSHLFGKISRERDIFVLSDLSQSLRKSAHAHRNRDTDLWNPYFVLIEEIGQHARTSDISQLFTKAHSEQGVMLFSKEENERWLKEFQNKGGSIITTSHDSGFLNEMCTHLIDFQNRKLNLVSHFV